MNALDDFAAAAGRRVPTPAEFAAFVKAMGWRIVARADGTAALRGCASDPLAKPLARMLSREPYRTGVLALARDWWGQEGAAPASAPPPEAAPAAPHLREWLWPGGLCVAEEAGWASAGDEAASPALALWWRWAGDGEGAWRVIGGKEDVARGRDRPLRREAGAAPAGDLEGALPVARRPHAEPAALAGQERGAGGAVLLEQGRLHLDGDPGLGGAFHE